MSIVCKNESTPAGVKKGMYTKEKRAKERAKEDEEDGRRRRTVTRTTEDEGEEGGRELKSKHRLSHGRGSRYTRCTLLHLCIINGEDGGRRWMISLCIN